ncbi:MAG: bacillithiol system redox-active protein YtxJ [Flavobacteriaceae bacterium]|jgi:bacillithiol system protein YtxJ|nr:bacillithiol system redox-active protein YtxJ [Flavobacteriaceae bacterium]
MGIFDRFKSNREAVKQEEGEQAFAKVSLPWNPLLRADQIPGLMNQSHDKPILIFKHSTRCIISAMVLRELEANAEKLTELGHWYYLDLIANRDCSNKIAQELKVVHQSPQLIIVRNGAVLWDASHQAITPETILDALTSA